MPLIATRGAASAQGFGEFAQTTAPVYIEDVFSTWLYTGNGSTQTITNNIDLSAKGGLVWFKSRSGTYGTQSHVLTSNELTNWTKYLSSNTTGDTAGLGATAFTPSTTGFALNSVFAGINDSGTNYASWTFREQPKFFDVVTYTGDGTSNRAINHSLGAVPGCVIVKKTNAAQNWAVWHRTFTTGDHIYLNTTGAVVNNTVVFGTNANTSTTFNVGSFLNQNGDTYVAYLFAHNAGGFGLTGTDNVISCGSWAGDTTVNLGYEPQWVLVKRTDAVDNWYLIDTMRGLTVNTSPAQTKLLIANSTAAENTSDYLAINATGFTGTFTAGNYIYIAIRRGPMKTPTSGTEVFYPYVTASVSNVGSTGGTMYNSQIVTDHAWQKAKGGTDGWYLGTRLTGTAYLKSEETNAESTSAAIVWDSNRGAWSFSDANYGLYCFKRAPGFMDVVCYTGTGSARTVSHNLGVAPELMIIKNRSSVNAWNVNAVVLGTSGNVLNLATSAAAVTSSSAYNSTAPTSSVFTVGTAGGTNSSGETYVAYLFASVSGVSKVGSYTGTGTTLQVNCGFTNGARFVLIKRTNSTGDWYVWDSARGIVAGNDPYLLLNSTAAEVTNTDYVDTYSAGFEISSTAPTAINANGSTFIFLAIA